MSDKNPDTCTATLLDQSDGSIACPECGLKIVLPKRSVKQGKPTKEQLVYSAARKEVFEECKEITKRIFKTACNCRYLYEKGNQEHELTCRAFKVNEVIEAIELASKEG